MFSSKSKRDRPEPWPVHPTAGITPPKFLFVLTPPCCGSTLLAKVLNSAPRTMLLHPKAEGLWLVPGTNVDQRWDPAFEINWESVRSVWLQRIEMVRSLVGSIDLVIEKSPILLTRASELQTVFPDNHSVILNRDPYASCSSFFHRYHDPKMETDRRRHEFRVLARKWVARSRILRTQAEELQIERIAYEAFCADPAGHVRDLARKIPELRDVDTEIPVKVKDYPVQKITNQNVRQLDWLTDADRAELKSVFVNDEGVLDYFGYSV